jgi:DedD protein
MAEAQDIDALKRRGRRRLVGAVALVLLAVIALPMVFDPEPRRSAPPVSVRIPGEEDAGFAPKVTPKTPPVTPAPAPKPVEPPKPQAAAPQPAPPPAAVKSQQAERSRAEAALADLGYVFQVGAFSTPEKVKELTAKLAAEKLPYYTEGVATAKGKVTRVRVGPFASRAEAEKALARLKGLGFKPGNVVSKSG